MLKQPVQNNKNEGLLRQDAQPRRSQGKEISP